ncbi:hypothetical protein GGR58DRAFT_210091 [Xylaria digitata]|nr:hypothetical protein GGR58DRAFT_210091 [Xylaria digitata]
MLGRRLALNEAFVILFIHSLMPEFQRCSLGAMPRRGHFRCHRPSYESMNNMRQYPSTCCSQELLVFLLSRQTSPYCLPHSNHSGAYISYLS